jgi:hypothetical protein
MTFFTSLKRKTIQTLKYIALAPPAIFIPFWLKVSRCTLKQITNIIRDLTEELQQEHQSKKIRTEKLSFAACKSIITFTELAENFYTPHQPKLTAEPIMKLKYLVTISTACSREMTD